MSNKFLILLTVVFFVFNIACNTESTDKTQPNIIYILADDLGYGELGAYGQKLIETPNIDRLAVEGMRFTQHYAGAPVCAPSRYVLLTGKHLGHAYIRGNDEWGERGEVWNFEAAVNDPNLEGQRPIPANTKTIGKILQDNGYTTGCIGKWGLGAPFSEGTPNKQGFDFFYGYNCQRQAHTYYPKHLWKNEEKVLLNNPLVAPHTNLDSLADPYNPESYSNFNLEDLSTELMQNEVLDFIEQNQDKPFFLLYASPIPHAPLQAPDDWVKYYQEKFGKEEPYLGNKGYFPNLTPKATYAAMISHLDEQVGELVTKLKELGLYENTIIIFSSDNGPSYAGGADPVYFNSAQPFRGEYGRGKGFVYEGGIRVPMIVSWPGKIEAGSESQHISSFYDVLPTICDLSDSDSPDSIDGISFTPTLLNNTSQKTHDFLYWDFPEYGGQQAVRMGKWKGVRRDIKKGNLGIELYDLSNDILEEHNIADQHPEIVKKVEDIMMQEHTIAEIERFRMPALGDK
ncbi:MAG: arylsulfatase [Bacteroidota bacterium]